jgi:TPR repeat protein
VLGSLEDGKVAFQRGDYAAAIRHWRPLAEQGEYPAQSDLGYMYEKGYGVPKDDALIDSGSGGDVRRLCDIERASA